MPASWRGSRPTCRHCQPLARLNELPSDRPGTAPLPSQTQLNPVVCVPSQHSPHSVQPSGPVQPPQGRNINFHVCL
ncbi:hypothetical protein QQF64_032973 [Cirrhinus molitorella]|uniref:Uncharacterized protein n=1 Tax=Cirrhinus molitorella TaxID=172907 RepID=A0ABR3MSR6_9TELE